MANDLLQKFNYNTGENTPFEGTEDWVEVAQLGDENGGYEWTEFKAFYSPSARRYFWHGDSGCSCNGWTDEVNSAGDFEDGDKAALLRAWEAFAKDHEYSIPVSVYLPGVSEIRNFKESK